MVYSSRKRSPIEKLITITYNLVQAASIQVNLCYWFINGFFLNPNRKIFYSLRDVKRPRIIRRKTPFFNYVFNYFSIVIYSWNHHFQLQNVFCNSKMTLSTNFQNSQQCWVNPTTQLKTMYMCQFVGQCGSHNILVENDIHFSWLNISIVKCWLDLIDSMLANQWMKFIHLSVMSFGGVELELWLSFNYITINVVLAHVMSLRKGMECLNFDYYSIIL
jgi:hypothetical protein